MFYTRISSSRQYNSSQSLEMVLSLVDLSLAGPMLTCSRAATRENDLLENRVAVVGDGENQAVDTGKQDPTARHRTQLASNVYFNFTRVLQSSRCVPRASGRVHILQAVELIKPININREPCPHWSPNAAHLIVSPSSASECVPSTSSSLNIPTTSNQAHQEEKGPWALMGGQKGAGVVKGPLRVRGCTRCDPRVAFGIPKHRNILHTTVHTLLLCTLH